MDTLWSEARTILWLNAIPIIIMGTVVYLKDAIPKWLKDRKK